MAAIATVRPRGSVTISWVSCALRPKSTCSRPSLSAFVFARGRACLPGEEEEQVGLGRERDLGESPFVQLGQIVGERIAGQVERLGARVVEFDPVRSVPRLVVESGVAGAVLVDQERRGFRRHRGLDRRLAIACRWPCRASASPK